MSQIFYAVNEFELIYN